MKNLLLLIASITLLNCSTTIGPQEDCDKYDTFTVNRTEWIWNNKETEFPLPLDTTNLNHYWYELEIYDFDTGETFVTSTSTLENPEQYFDQYDTHVKVDMNGYWEAFRNGSQTIKKLILNQAYQY
jgi:hypothetical protein